MARGATLRDISKPTEYVKVTKDMIFEYDNISISIDFIFHRTRWRSFLLTCCFWLQQFELFRDLLHQVIFHLGKVTLGNLLARVQLHLVTKLIDLT